MAWRSAWGTVVRRGMTILIGSLTYVVFIVVGLPLYAFMVTRGVIGFSWAFFRAAMSDSGQTNAAAFDYLEQAIDFFPRGVERIWAMCQLLWLGKKPQQTELLTRNQLTTDLVLAILFYGFLYLVLVHGGIAGIADGAKSARAVPSFVFGLISLALIGGYFGMKIIQHQFAQDDKKSNVDINRRDTENEA